MIMSSSSTTSSSSSSQSAIGGGAIVERIQRVELLRAELDRSLKMAAAAASLNSATAKRSPLCILFRAADSVHIQFSGSARSSPIDLFTKPRSAAVTAPSSAGNAITGAISRFTVSPTPNAVPPAAFGNGDSPKFCSDRGTGTQMTTALLPRSLSSLSVLTTATSAAANANNNRHGDDGGGGANNGRAGGDDSAAASAAIAAAELLAPPSPSAPPTVAAEKDDENNINGKTADFVVPPPSTNDRREDDGATATMPPFKPSPVAEGAVTVAASSPATSVDSGVASPGAAADYLLLNGSSSSLRAKESTAADKSEQYNNTNNSANSPCWATVPRTRRRIFNFGTIIAGDTNSTGSNESPLIDALTLSSTMSSSSSICTTTTGASTKPQKTGQHSSTSSMAPMPSLTLQRPPLKKKYGQPNTTTDCEQQSLSQLCQPSSNVSSSSSSPYGYNNVNSFNVMATTVNGNASSLVAPLSPPKTGPSGPQVAIVSAKLIITSNGIEKEGDQMSTAASVARRTPLSIVQTAGGAVHRQLSDSMCYKSGHSNGSGNENNDGGADSDTTLDRPAYCGDGLPPRSATMPPLRSILKKPRAPQPPSPVPANNDSTLLMMTKMAFANGAASGQQQQLQQHQQPNRFTMVPSPMPRNHLRRVPTRLVLERSVSDSVLDDAAIPDDQFSALQHSAAAAFNASILRRLSSSSSTMSPGGGLLGSFDEQLEDNIVDNKTEQFMHQQQQGSNGNGGNNSSSSSSCPSSCSSETIDTDGSAQSAAPAPIVKKRVSFSECVHARYFRSNSSILGQKKKNEKKSRKRTSRRCNSDIVHPSDEVSSQQQQSSSSSTLSQHNHHNDCDESCPWIVWKH